MVLELKNNPFYQNIFDYYGDNAICDFHIEVLLTGKMYHLTVDYYDYDDQKKQDLWFRYDEQPYQKALIDKYEGNLLYNSIYLHYFKNKLLMFQEKVSHDGYDAYGPESNLYDLIVYYLDSDNKLRKDLWHREYWYHGSDNEEYTLEEINVN